MNGMRIGVSLTILALVCCIGFVGRAAPASAEMIRSKESGVDLYVKLSKPDGEGPFPAVVLLHGCSGTERNTGNQTVWRGLKRHAAFLNDRGFVTLIVDSFAERRAGDSCGNSSKYVPRRVGDAYAGLEYLASRPFVDADRIGAVGFSQGGGVSLFSVSEMVVRKKTAYSIDSPVRFRAAVAFYPWCGYSYGSFFAPVLVLIGEKDDWTPARHCTVLEKMMAFGSDTEFDVVVYPGAYHSFDMPIERAVRVYGHWVNQNPSAFRDAQERMAEFFARHLSQQ